MEETQEEQYKEETQPVASYGLLYITQAYNRHEITLDEWMKLSREWAEKIIQQYGS